MAKIDIKIVLIVALMLPPMCAGCSGKDAVNPRSEKPTREFSAEERRAAGTLSISRVRAVTIADSGYAKALLCKNGLDMTAQRLQKLSVMNAEQRLLLKRAQAHFDRQTDELGGGQGKSATEISNDLVQTAESHSDANENARIAVSCLQSLQETG